MEYAFKNYILVSCENMTIEMRFLITVPFSSTFWLNCAWSIKYIFINRAAMGQARFMFYPWFIFFYFFFVGDQTQISTRPTLNYAICNVYSPNLVSSGSTEISDYKITLNLHVAKKSLQNPDIEAIYHFSVNSLHTSAEGKSIP